jgi:murein L,D-transpeptidase YcbB/YkuD
VKAGDTKQGPLWKRGGFCFARKPKSPANRIIRGVSTDFTRPTLSRGSKGPEVSDVQRKLEIHVSGVFDYGTEAEVMKFQIAHGLKADGIVGKKTHLALFGSEDRQTWTEFRESE